jgi:dihydrofolate synthase/folylpolyglutamate synthase
LDRSWAEVRIPARLEVFGSRPWILIDGAHNAASAQALVDTVCGCFPRVERTVVFGTTRDKDVEGQLDALAPIADRMILTRYLENPRALPIKEARMAWESAGGVEPIAAETPAAALEHARAVTPEEGLIIITGSLFLAAEMRELVLGGGGAGKGS